jgi:cytidylate kinase
MQSISLLNHSVGRWRKMMPDFVPVITVDGPSGSGKGTVCRLLADKLGYHLLDSGALYRLTAVAGFQQRVDLQNVSVITEVARHLDVQFQLGDVGVVVLLSGIDVTRDIRQEKASMGASVVAAHPSVRDALLARQRAFRQFPGLVADGRDMGTTVFPNAPVKVFLTASAEERAERRYKQLIEGGESVNLRALLDDIRARDQHDMDRSVSPLKPAADALEIDSTSMNIDEVLAKVLSLVAQRIDIDSV